MPSFNELDRGTTIIIDNYPYEITEAAHLFKGRGHSVLQAKLKNLVTGNLISKTFHPSDSFEQAELSKIEIVFLYCHRDNYFFCEKNKPSERFSLTKEQVGKAVKFLKQNQSLSGIVFKNKIVNVSLPVKVALKVTESPPGIKGGRKEPGNKIVTLETGAKVAVPLFIKEGDIIEINTEKDQYVRRKE